MRPKFRETLWFKKGEQDAKARDEAVAAGDLLAPSAVDTLPIEDRYEDDGTVNSADSQVFGIHTGTTEYIPKARHSAFEIEVNERAMVGDLKRGRYKVLAAMGGAVVVIAVLVTLLV
ncbi:MAG TPA: hypothetical protein VH143_11905 [Kofleriaceae bacterium]|jgi:hypothetical protein|nr:hypothetical protein [Kofleriaceae bacterium]